MALIDVLLGTVAPIALQSALGYWDGAEKRRQKDEEMQDVRDWRDKQFTESKRQYDETQKLAQRQLYGGVWAKATEDLTPEEIKLAGGMLGMPEAAVTTRAQEALRFGKRKVFRTQLDDIVDKLRSSTAVTPDLVQMAVDTGEITLRPGDAEFDQTTDEKVIAALRERVAADLLTKFRVSGASSPFVVQAMMQEKGYGPYLPVIGYEYGAPQTKTVTGVPTMPVPADVSGKLISRRATTTKTGTQTQPAVEFTYQPHDKTKPIRGVDKESFGYAPVKLMNGETVWWPKKDADEYAAKRDTMVPMLINGKPTLITPAEALAHADNEKRTKLEAERVRLEGERVAIARSDLANSNKVALLQLNVAQAGLATEVANARLAKLLSTMAGELNPRLKGLLAPVTAREAVRATLFARLNTATETKATAITEAGVNPLPQTMLDQLDAPITNISAKITALDKLDERYINSKPELKELYGTIGALSAGASAEELKAAMEVLRKAQGGAPPVVPPVVPPAIQPAAPAARPAAPAARPQQTISVPVRNTATKGNPIVFNTEITPEDRKILTKFGIGLRDNINFLPYDIWKQLPGERVRRAVGAAGHGAVKAVVDNPDLYTVQ